MRAGPLAIALALALWSSCGYIGEPLPPLLNIPSRVTDLSAIERGSKILVQFSTPPLTTEGSVLKSIDHIELHAGIRPAAGFNPDTWAAAAKSFNIANPSGRVRYELPAAEWAGKDVVFGVKVFGSNGRVSDWSNFIALQVVPPLERPANLSAEAVPTGVKLTWKARGPAFRISREGNPIGMSDRPEWIDTTTEYGKRYRYSVQAYMKSGDAEVQSEESEQVEITPEDRFPPAVPAGLTAVASIQSIELAWERNTEPDLAGYRVYRAAPDGNFERMIDALSTPSYSDRKIESGKRYRYAVSSVDKLGNESQMSLPVEIVAP